MLTETTEGWENPENPWSLLKELLKPLEDPKESENESELGNELPDELKELPEELNPLLEKGLTSSLKKVLEEEENGFGRGGGSNKKN